MAKTIKGITIEIGGNTVNLGKALKNADKVSKDLNIELNNINRSLKFNPNSTVLLAQKQEVLKASIEASREKLKELDAVQQDIERAYKNGEIDDGQYRAFQREVETTENRLEGYEKELNSVKKNQAEFDKKIEQSRQVLERNKTSLKAGVKTVGKYGAAVVGALGAAAGAAIKYAADFETSFAKVTTLLDENTVDFENYKKEILDVSNETGMAANDVATSVYDALSAGVSSDKAVSFVKKAYKLSKGGFTEIAKSVDLLTTIQNAYQLSTKKTTHISNVLLNTQNKGKVLVGELAQYMGKVIPVASAYGVSLEQLGAGYAILTARGIKAAQSTTYLKSLFDELAKVKYNSKGAAISLGAQLKDLTGKTFADFMKEGKSVADVLNILYKSVGKNNTAFGQLFSKSNARSAALALMKAGVKKFNTELKGMKNSSGVAEKAYNKMANTAAHKTEVLKTNIQNSAIAIGDGMLPVVEELLSYVEKNLPEIQRMAQGLGRKLGKDLKWILDNADTVIADIKAIIKIGGSIYAAFKLKQFITALGETVAAMRILKTATDAETASQIALNTAQKANVIGAIAAGLTVLIGATWAAKGAFDEYTKATSKWTTEEKALHREIKENAKALSEAKEARDENLAGIDAEYGHYDSLREELDKIVDKNGEVKKGYKSRAKFITSTLSDALGTEFEWNGKIIQNYKDIRKEIKKTIKAKREEAKLNAYKEDYEKAVKTASGGKKSQDYKKFTDAIEKRNKDEKRLKKAEKELKKHGGDKSGALGTGTTDAEYIRLKNIVDKREDDLEKSRTDVTDAWNTYTKNRDLIANYEKASAAVIEGHHKTAKKTLTALSEEISLAGNATNKIAGAQLVNQYKEYQKKYLKKLKAYANGDQDVTRTTVTEAERRRNEAITQLNKYADNVGKSATEVGTYVGKALSSAEIEALSDREKTKEKEEKFKKVYEVAKADYKKIANSLKKGEGEITKEQVEAAKKRKVAALNSLKKYRQTVTDKAIESAKSIGNAQSKVDTEDNKEKAKSRGKNLTDAVAEGTKPTDEQKDKVKKNSKKLAKAASSTDLLDYVRKKASGLGASFAAGFIGELLIKSALAAEAARKFITSAIFGAQKAQDSHSPSKKTKKLSYDWIDGFIMPIEQSNKEAYNTAYDFVKSANKGAAAAQSAYSFTELSKAQGGSYDFNSVINHKLIAAAPKNSNNTPKVDVSSPIIQITFGDVQVNDKNDINDLSDTMSQRIAAEIVSINRGNGG